MKKILLGLLGCLTAVLASEQSVDALTPAESVVLTKIASFSGEALRLDGVLGAKKANEKCILLFNKSRVEGEIKSKMVEICSDIASGKRNYFTPKKNPK